MAKNQWLWVLALVLGIAQVDCKDCQDDKEAMQAFLDEPSHLACESTEDCRVVSVGCTQVRRSLCGQVQLNKTAAASSSWKSLQSAADDCDGDCAVCDAALLPGCGNGFCGGPP